MGGPKESTVTAWVRKSRHIQRIGIHAENFVFLADTHKRAKARLGINVPVLVTAAEDLYFLCTTFLGLTSRVRFTNFENTWKQQQVG